jgi:hypothetical protein
LIQRYETRLHRTFQRALSNLVLMRSLDKPRDLPPGEPPVSESKSEEGGEEPVPVEALAEQESAAATGTFDDHASDPLRGATSDPDAADLNAAAALPAPACPPPFDPVERDVAAALASIRAPWPGPAAQQPTAGAVGTVDRSAGLNATAAGNQPVGTAKRTQPPQYQPLVYGSVDWTAVQIETNPTWGGPGPVKSRNEHKGAMDSTTPFAKRT